MKSLYSRDLDSIKNNDNKFFKMYNILSGDRTKKKNREMETIFG